MLKDYAAPSWLNHDLLLLVKCLNRRRFWTTFRHGFCSKCVLNKIILISIVISVICSICAVTYVGLWSRS